MRLERKGRGRKERESETERGSKREREREERNRTSGTEVKKNPIVELVHNFGIWIGPPWSHGQAEWRFRPLCNRPRAAYLSFY